MTKRTIKFVCNAVKWFDKVNGNTYHSVRITRCRDGAVAAAPLQYGYGDHYRQTALWTMLQAGWFNNIKRKMDGKAIGKYDQHSIFSFERENNYPILWEVSEGKKRDCVENGKL